jgi:RNA polymerase sigma-70 factor (ECF subfamily)
MADPPTTRPSLLVRLRDGADAEAWGEFVRLYAPLVYGYARKRGLQDADAADLTQEVMRTVARVASRFHYDPRRGSFHGWLFTVAYRQVKHFLAGRRHRPRGSGDSAVQVLLDEQPAPEPEAASLWDEDFEQQLMARALERVRGLFRDSTWRAFWLTAVEGKKAKEAADTLGMSVTAVYMAKSRVLGQLRQEVEHWRTT